MPAKHPLKSDIYMNKNGTPNKGNLYKKLRQSRLKECHIVRYADDFKTVSYTHLDVYKRQGLYSNTVFQSYENR